MDPPWIHIIVALMATIWPPSSCFKACWWQCVLCKTYVEFSSTFPMRCCIPLCTHSEAAHHLHSRTMVVPLHWRPSATWANFTLSVNCRIRPISLSLNNLFILFYFNSFKECNNICRDKGRERLSDTEWRLYCVSHNTENILLNVPSSFCALN